MMCISIPHDLTRVRHTVVKFHRAHANFISGVQHVYTLFLRPMLEANEYAYVHSNRMEYAIAEDSTSKLEPSLLAASHLDIWVSENERVKHGVCSNAT